LIAACPHCAQKRPLNGAPQFSQCVNGDGWVFRRPKNRLRDDGGCSIADIAVSPKMSFVTSSAISRA